MMLAEATNNDVITWGVILVLTTIAANIAVIIGTRRTQKREVSFEFTPASKEEFDSHVAFNKSEHENLFSKLGGMERGLRGEFSSELKTVRSEMVEAAKQLSALNNNANMLNQAMTAERSRLDREIERRRQ